MVENCNFHLTPKLLSLKSNSKSNDNLQFRLILIIEVVQILMHGTSKVILQTLGCIRNSNGQAKISVNYNNAYIFRFGNYCLVCV